MKVVRSFLVLTAALATIGVSPVSQARADAGPKGTLAVLVKVDATSITLLELGQTASVTAAVSAPTMITGVCHDCQQPMTFKIAAASKTCWVCPCDVSAAACISQKPLKPGTWNQLIAAMPAGTGLEVVFNVDGKPESGVKSLVINQKRELVAVDGPGKLDAAGLLAALKPLGVRAAEFAADHKQIALRVTEAWTDSKATKLGQLLAANGIKVLPPGAA